jgi:hypothetical protein
MSAAVFRGCYMSVPLRFAGLNISKPADVPTGRSLRSAQNGKVSTFRLRAGDRVSLTQRERSGTTWRSFRYGDRRLRPVTCLGSTEAKRSCRNTAANSQRVF